MGRGVRLRGRGSASEVRLGLQNVPWCFSFTSAPLRQMQDPASGHEPACPPRRALRPTSLSHSRDICSLRCLITEPRSVHGHFLLCEQQPVLLSEEAPRTAAWLGGGH